MIQFLVVHFHGLQCNLIDDKKCVDVFCFGFEMGFLQHPWSLYFDTDTVKYNENENQDTNLRAENVHRRETLYVKSPPCFMKERKRGNFFGHFIQRHNFPESGSDAICAV